jgi:hypothetical protein
MRRAFFVACTAEVVIARRTATKRFSFYCAFSENWIASFGS